MSAEAVLHAAVLSALRADAALKAGLNGVFEGPPVKATAPYAELGELLSVDWGVKDAAGREIMIALTIRDLGEAPARLHALAAAAGAAIAGVPRDLDGWRIASLVFVRTRVLRAAPGAWAALIDHRARMMAS